MSMLMIRPGPLEGGPTVSPGSAKGGEDFSAHFKNACAGVKKEARPAPNNRVLDKPKENDAPPAEKAPAPKSDVAPNEKPSNPTPGRTKGKGSLPQKGSEKGAEVASEKETLLLEVPENPENNPAAIPLNIIKVVEPSVDEVVPDQGKEDLPQERTLGENSPELPLILSEKPEESPSESEPAKEDSAKTQRTLFGSPPPVPIPMGMVIVQSPELNQQVEAENSATSQEKEGSVLIPATPGVMSGETSPVDAQKPEIVSDKDRSLPPQVPDAKGSAAPLPLKESPKKQGTSPSDPVSAPGEENNTTPDRPGMQSWVDPQNKGVGADLSGPLKQIQEKEIRRDPPPVKETPAPVAILPPNLMAQGPLMTDAIPKPKDAPGLAPIQAGTPALGEGPVLVTTGIGSQTAPVSDPAQVKVERPAPPVVTPSPIDLARQIHVHLESGRSVVRIDLHPNHLGELRISMETKGKDVSMQFTVDNDQARTAVVAGLREITGTLSSLGWSVNGLAVHVSSGGVGDGRGDTPGTLWGQGKSNSNTVAPETKPVASSPATGRWRVNLVA